MVTRISRRLAVKAAWSQRLTVICAAVVDLAGEFAEIARALDFSDRGGFARAMLWLHATLPPRSKHLPARSLCTCWPRRTPCVQKGGGAMCVLQVGPAKDFSKSDSKFACARSARKFSRNLPVLIQCQEFFEKFAYVSKEILRAQLPQLPTRSPSTLRASGARALVSLHTYRDTTNDVEPRLAPNTEGITDMDDLGVHNFAKDNKKRKARMDSHPRRDCRFTRTDAAV